jgi:hypothetical protein
MNVKKLLIIAAVCAAASQNFALGNESFLTQAQKNALELDYIAQEKAAELKNNTQEVSKKARRKAEKAARKVEKAARKAEKKARKN